MILRYFIISLAFLSISCQTDTSNHTEDLKQIRQMLDQQQLDWNNGDHPAFMTAYWNSEELRFVGSGGVSYGYETLLKMYQTSFPDRERMGQLEFSLDSFNTSRYPIISVDGRWTLYRKDTAGGNFVLFFEKKEGEWKITEDHTW